MNLHALIYFQWSFTLIYSILIFASFWKLEIIKFLILVKPFVIGVSLYDFDDNRLTMKN